MSDNMQIMDVTLRDGSYAINFQFSEYDTEKICAGLYESGIKYIEIGHGMGLEASSPAGGLALCTDKEYLQAAKRVVPDAKYGMFCIPTYASVDSLNLLKENGASFVRVGSNVSEVETTKEYIERAKALGLEVMANYMKSYVATPEEFAENVKKSEAWGADVVYVVDSAGSMDNHDVEKYFEAVKKVSNIKVGFHGHNNLGLAVANSVYAMDLGYDFVDTAMLGMGRSAGNAATELFVGNLVKRKAAEGIELDKIMECAEKYVRPLMKHYPNALDLYCGIAQFHTSYMKYIQKYSMKYRVNPLKLILEYSEYDKVNMDEAALDRIASRMAKDENCVLTDFGFNEYIGDEQNGRK